MKWTFAAATAVALACAPALAQGNKQLQAPGGIIASISPHGLIAIYETAGLKAAYQSFTENAHIIEVDAAGVTTYAALRACDGALQTSKCALVESFAVFGNVGMTLAQTNQLNMTKMNISTVMLLPENISSIGSKAIVDGGVTEANLKNYLGIFFLDVAAFAEGVEQGAAAQVSFDAEGPFVGAAVPGLDLPKRRGLHVNSHGGDLQVLKSAGAVLSTAR